MMPVMDGFEFVQKLREDENNRWIPIIVVTAKDLSEEDRQQDCWEVSNISLTKGHSLRMICCSKSVIWQHGKVRIQPMNKAIYRSLLLFIGIDDVCGGLQ